jgi:hypothetical protein
MAKDDPGRQPFIGSCSVTGPAGSSGIGDIAPVPPRKRLVVEAVSAVVVMSTAGRIDTIQINSPFVLFMIPVIVSDGPFNLRRYFSTHSIRFYADAGRSLQFQVASVGAPCEATCYVSGYLLDV